MASVNKVIVVGNLGRDPEIKYSASGDPIANITVATSSKYKNKQGEMVEDTEWHRITFFGKLADIVGQYLKKGKSVYVEGRLKTTKYTDKDGIEKYSTSIIANEMHILGVRDDGGSQSPRNEPRQAQRQAPAQQPSGFDDGMEDDIP